MNKLIKQLAVEAMEYADGYDDHYEANLAAIL